MKTKHSKTLPVLPIRIDREFSNLCRFWSTKVYPEGLSIKCGSAAHFLKEAAKEKLLSCGIPKKYLDSIT